MALKIAFTASEAPLAQTARAALISRYGEAPEAEADIKAAKALCGECPVRAKCLAGALSRQEPVGVWGGELFEDGVVIQAKRKAGRPRIAA